MRCFYIKKYNEIEPENFHLVGERKPEFLMNSHTTQTSPDRFYNLPHRQKRNFRRQIKNANPEEIDAFLQYDILPKAAFQPKFLLILLLNAALFTVTILFGSIPLLLVVVISAPFAAQILNLSLGAVMPSFKLFWRGLLGTFLTAFFYFGSGWLAANMAGKHWSSSGIPLTFLRENGVIEGVVLSVAVIVFTWHCLNQKELPRLSSALMSILIFAPFGLVGWVAYGSLELAGEALIIYCLPRLTWSFLLSLLTFWIAGLPPRHVKGWLIFFLAGALFAVSIVAYRAYGPVLSHSISYSPYSAINSSVATTTQPAPTFQPSQTRPVASPTATSKPISTLTPTASITLTPTPGVAIINSETGVKLRAEPDTNAQVLAYLNNLAEIELLGETKLVGENLWQKVQAPDGKIGWIMDRYLMTATPVR